MNFYRIAATNELMRDLKKIKNDFSSLQDENGDSLTKLKSENEQLATAILHVRQSVRQSIEEQIFGVDLRLSDDSKKVDCIIELC